MVGGSGAIALGSTGNAFIYSAGQTTDIGNLGGGTATAAAINASGEVVGISAIPSGNTIPIGTYPTAAFIYRNGAMTDLNALAPPSQTGWNLQGATDINNAGQITALAIPAGNMPVSSIEAVLLTPVAASAASPRPSSSPAQRAAVFPQPAGSKSPDGMPLGRSTSGSQRHLSIPATSSPRHHYR